MPTVQELLASVDAARDEIVRLHQDLVRIPTLNYGSRPDTGNETPACELVRDKLKADGIDSDIYESAPTRGKTRDWPRSTAWLILAASFRSPNSTD